MGEKNIVEIANRWRGKTVKDLRDLRGVAYALGARESEALQLAGGAREPTGRSAGFCPSFEEVKADKGLRRSDADHPHNTNPFNAKALVQYHDRRRWSQSRRRCRFAGGDGPHLRSALHAPAASVLQGADPRPRDDQGFGHDHARLLRRLHLLLDHGAPGTDHPVALAGIDPAASAAMAADPEFKGVISDIGGPTANMYQMRCTRPEVEAKCKRLSCVHPTICKLLGTDHGPLIELMKKAAEPGIKRCSSPAASAWTWPSFRPKYVQGTGGAPRRRTSEGRPRAHRARRARADEEAVDRQLRGLFADSSRSLSKRRQAEAAYLCRTSSPAIPARDLGAMIDLAVFLKRNGYRPDQVQDFIPAPFDIATCMYYTGSTRSRKRSQVAKACGPEDAAGADAVLQAGELLHRARGDALYRNPVDGSTTRAIV
jgi:hypothetical protein